MGLDPESIKVFKKLISERRMKKSDILDNLIWVGSKEGKYSVKQGYKALVHSQCWELVEMMLKLCRDSACFPKAGFYLWLTIQNRVLTTNRLSRFSIIGPTWCVLCK